MAKTLYSSWDQTPYKEKEKMVDEFLKVMREKLLKEDTKEINISLNKGVSKVFIGSLLLEQIYDARETYTIKLNHNGDL